MRLLIFGHYSDTGFGVVTQELGARLLDRGYDVRVIAVNHRGNPVKLGDEYGRVWPAGMFRDDFGGNLSHEAITGSLWTTLNRRDHWTPEAVLLVADISSAVATVGRRGYGPFAQLPAFHYCPVEGRTYKPGLWRDVWENLRPVAMSRFGADYMEELIGRPVPMVYHGISPTFHPVSRSEPILVKGKEVTNKREARAAFGLEPDRRYILRTDRMVERKAYHTFLDALVPVLRRHGDVDALIHCAVLDEGSNLLEEISDRIPADLRSPDQGGTSDRKRVIPTMLHDTFTGLPTDELAALYNAADIYFSPTMGEGFGLTLGEAVACAVPVVTTDVAAGPEVVGPGGVLVPPLRDAHGDIVHYRSRYQMDWFQPDARACTEAIESLLSSPSRAQRLGEAGRAHIASFTWDAAAEQFAGIFEEATDDLRARVA